VLDRILFASLPALFSLTLFMSAGLLFLVELMIAKMILPLFGGTPAVWNTCMMFFQAMLLAGYGYAHISGTKAEPNRQIMIHLAILLVACIVLPIAIPRHWAPSAEGSPIGTILLLLLISVGLPFFGISATAPLLQKWFARTGHPSAGDPYFLYSASNLGSMLALIGYPTLIEPNFRLVEQGRAWAIGYIVILALTAFCALVSRKYMQVCVSEEKGKSEPGACVADDSRLTYKERGWWTLLAFVPSSMMLGVTIFLSTDIAAIPLFWVIPLSLYLLSFIIVFARVPAGVHRIMVRLLPISIAALIFANFSDIGIPKWIIFIFHLVNFFFYCMVCHGEIARTRPATKHLTEFYLWISIGGVLGGIFNSLLAPVIFNSVLEYFLILALGAMLLPVGNRNGLRPLTNWRNLLLYLGVPLVLVLLTYWSTAKWHAESINLSGISELMNVKPETLYPAIAYGSLGFFCYGLVFLRKPFLFGIGIASVLLTVVVSRDLSQNVVYRERSFFGVLTVAKDASGRFMTLAHGTTLHGKQWLDPIKRHEPVAYYHPQGPAGQVFAEFEGRKKKARIAVTGLGTGSLAPYAGPGQEIDFYEIDPTVKKISTDPEYFSFLSECKADWKIILGDARFTMEKAPPHSYGIIILDAFSSDAIPVHLITKEAINLYFSKLREDGILLIHISNKYVNLAPVLARLADESGLAGRICDDEEDDEIGKYGTTWVLLARKETDFGGLARSDAWKKIESQKTVNVWTDDFSNILSVFKW
jgi:hypothetical protein